MRFLQGSTARRLSLRACKLRLVSAAHSRQIETVLAALETYARTADELRRQATAMGDAVIEIAGASPALDNATQST